MKTYTRYSEDFKEQALAKVYSRRNDQSIQDVADDLHICLQTLKTWMKKTKLDSSRGLQSKQKRPQDWRPDERLAALQLTYGLIGEDLNAWCRGQGLFVHQLEQWKADFCRQGDCDFSKPVMLMHSSRDKLFPNYVKEAIEWWAKCNKCTTKTYKASDRKVPESGKAWGWENYYKQELEQKALDLKPGQPLPFTTPVPGVEGCMAYSGCKNGVQTWYCEGNGPHPEWPGRNKEIISFFKAVKTD